jgi:hypothetical protein
VSGSSGHSQVYIYTPQPYRTTFAGALRLEAVEEEGARGNNHEGAAEPDACLARQHQHPQEWEGHCHKRVIIEMKDEPSYSVIIAAKVYTSIPSIHAPCPASAPTQDKGRVKGSGTGPSAKKASPTSRRPTAMVCLWPQRSLRGCTRSAVVE